jgi:hypothetical protein
VLADAFDFTASQPIERFPSSQLPFDTLGGSDTQSLSLPSNVESVTCIPEIHDSRIIAKGGETRGAKENVHNQLQEEERSQQEVAERIHEVEEEMNMAAKGAENVRKEYENVKRASE